MPLTRTKEGQGFFIISPVTLCISLATVLCIVMCDDASDSTGGWTYMGGYTEIDRAGSFNDSIPFPKYRTMSWTVASENAAYSFGGTWLNVSSNWNDLWRYNLTSHTWSWKGGSKVAPGNTSQGTLGQGNFSNVPGGRVSGATWTLGSNLWLYGGYGSIVYSDLWMYDTLMGWWVWQAGSTTNPFKWPSYGTRGVAAASNTPGSRVGASTWTASDGSLYLFGGYSNASTTSWNDLWKLNVTSMWWTWTAGPTVPNNYNSGNSGPSARYAAMTWTGPNDAFYLYGGQYVVTGAPSSFLSDVWQLNISTSTWAQLGRNNPNAWGTYNGPSMWPGGRAAAAAWSGSSDDFYIFGGFGYDQYGARSDLNDLWM